jgi:hypothetical protein
LFLTPIKLDLDPGSRDQNRDDLDLGMAMSFTGNGYNS